MSNTPSLEVAIKKFTLGFEWDDAELSREGILDLMEFPEALQALMANPVVKALGENKNAAQMIGPDVDLQECIKDPTFKALYVEKKRSRECRNLGGIATALGS